MVVIEAEGESSAIPVTGGGREHRKTFRKDRRRTSLSIAFRGADLVSAPAFGQTEKSDRCFVIERPPQRRSSGLGAESSRPTPFALVASQQHEQHPEPWPLRSGPCWPEWDRWSLG